MAALVPRYEVPLGLRIAWNLGLAFYTAGVGVLLLLDQRVPKDKAEWVHEPKLLVPAVSGLIAITLLDTIRRALVRSTVVRRERVSVAVRNQLASVLVSVAETHTLNVSDFGCGLFLLQEKSLTGRRPERLVRPERVRIPDDLHETAVEFICGKGAVGRAWKHQTAIHNDWIGINRRYAGKPEDIEARWDRLNEDTRRNFTMAEFKGMVGKYAEVLAVPIIENGVFHGCVAIDRRWNPNDMSDRLVLNNEATKKILGAAAKTLLAALKK